MLCALFVVFELGYVIERGSKRYMQLLSKSSVSGWCKMCVINFEVLNLIPTNKIKDVAHVVIGFVNSIVFKCCLHNLS